MDTQSFTGVEEKVIPLTLKVALNKLKKYIRVRHGVRIEPVSASTFKQLYRSTGTIHYVESSDPLEELYNLLIELSSRQIPKSEIKLYLRGQEKSWPNGFFLLHRRATCRIGYEIAEAAGIADAPGLLERLDQYGSI